jgi:hypothetical protein
MHRTQVKRLDVFGWLLFFGGAAAYGQLPVDFGIKAGVSVTDSYNGNSSGGFDTFSNARDYILGGSIELRLVKQISVEADALFRPVNLAVTAVSPDTTTASRYATWEFPILAKYRFHFLIVKPLIEAGPSFRAHVSRAPDLSLGGITVGAGLDIKLPLLHISPDLRYTRWMGGSSGGTLPASFNVNQVEALVGVSF